PTETAANEPAPDVPGESAPADPAPPPEAAPSPSLYYFRAGVLEPASGIGATETAVLVPDMMFPIKDAPTFPPSQVYRYGGGIKGGDPCDVRDFTAPGRDDYWESRSTSNTTS